MFVHNACCVTSRRNRLQLISQNNTSRIHKILAEYIVGRTMDIARAFKVNKVSKHSSRRGEYAVGGRAEILCARTLARLNCRENSPTDETRISEYDVCNDMVIVCLARALENRKRDRFKSIRFDNSVRRLFFILYLAFILTPNGAAISLENFTIVFRSFSGGAHATPSSPYVS